jgi:VanZ family protein
MSNSRAREAADPLRFPRVWWSLGWALVAGVCVGSLLPGPVIAVVHVQDKALHAGTYFLLALWFGGLCEPRQQIGLGAALLALGFGLDWAQSATATRSFDLLDVAANGAGVLLGLALTSTVLSGWCRRVEVLLFGPLKARRRSV